MILSDSHMHTDFSTDGKVPPEEMVDEAVRRGLQSICITDHHDADFPFYEELGEKAFQLNVEQYFQRMREVKELFKNRINVRIGIELGLQKHLCEKYRQLTDQYDFDFVIGSIHLVNGKDPYYRHSFGEITDEALYRAAFETTLENLKENPPVDTLGHLDYIVRYGIAQEKTYHLEENWDVIDEILKLLIRQQKGLEVNTAGWKYGLSNCNPHIDILKRYKELGGEIVTIGSDAHAKEHIAYEFDRTIDLLKECGFHFYAEFRKRKPFFIEVA